MRTKFLFLFFLIALNLSAQNEFNNWFFGIGNGLNFSTPTPSLVLGSPINQNEGVATISDINGNLLFYTSGVNVYDRNHVIMPNGNGLLGDVSSTQSSIIVKKPLSSSIFYIFTADADLGVDGIRWSEVDMNLNGGLGAVTSNKNILLHTPSCEKLCAVRHCNGRDIWVISHDWGSNTFRTWLVDPSGVGSLVVWSNAGSVVSGVVVQNAYGQLKATSDGTRLGAAIYGLTGQNAGNRVEVYDFNNSTGVVSNAISLGNVNGAYGLEFSASGRMLYVTSNPGQLYQWDLCSPNIQGSKLLLQNMGAFGGSLQIANNGRIYIARGINKFLSSISFPEIYGGGCFYTANAVTLNGNSMFGLPNFPSYYLQPFIYPIDITQINCNEFCFSYPSISNTLTCGGFSPSFNYEWSFEDGTIETGLTVCKYFTNNQTVLLKIIRPCITDSIFIPVDIGNSSVNISPIYIVN